MTDWAQNKKEYRKFCLEHGEMPLFMQDWWLDTVCDKGNWQVCLSTDGGGTIRGVLPFYTVRYYGFKFIKMPDLTPYMGVWIDYPAMKAKTEALHRLQKQIITDLIRQLPSVAYYAQKHPPQLVNCLPFLWQGFKQSTRFSYCLEYSNKLEAVFANLKGSVRTEIRKAGTEIEVLESDDLKLFYLLQKKSFQRQGLKVPYSFEFLQRIDQSLVQRQSRKILVARDKKGNSHAGIYLLWDKRKAYNLLQGADPQYGKSGAIKYLLWQSIQFAHRHRLDFDFEGAMMPNIEPVFSAFGGDLISYHKIYKGGNLLFRFLSAIRNG